MATYYWIGGTGTWDDTNTTNWSVSSGGAGGSGPPLNTDNVVFDANSGTGTCTVAATAAGLDVSFTLSGVSVVLAASPTAFGAVTLVSGAIDLAGFELTCTTFTSNNSNVRSIAFGAATAAIVVTGNNGSVFTTEPNTNLSVSGNPVVRATYSGSVGGRSFASGTSIGESRAFDLQITAGSDAIGLAGGAGRGFKTVDFTGFSGTLTGGSSAVAFFGDMVLSPTMTLEDGSGLMNFASTGTQTLTTNGVEFKRPLYKGGSGVLTLLDNFTSGAGRNVQHVVGTIDSNGFDVVTDSFVASASPAKTLRFGSSTWTILGASWSADVASLTVQPDAGVINMTSASAKTFAGGGKAYPTLSQGGAGALTIQQSNTFANITNSVQPATITLTSGTTQTVGAFGVSGAAGNLVTLNTSTPGSQATLSDSTGTNSVSFVSLQDINATGGATWNAFLAGGNVDAGNNIGWDFFASAKKVFSAVFRSIFQPVFS